MAKRTDNRPAEVSFTPGTGEYADGDVIGGLLTFVFNANQGRIVTVLLVENDNEGAEVDLFLFSEQPSTIADNAAFAPTIADMQKLVRKVALPAASYFTENSLKGIQVDMTPGLPFWTDTMYGYLVANGGAHTFGASKTIQIRLIQNGER